MNVPQGRFGLRSFPCRLERDNGKEFRIGSGAIRSQKVDPDGVGAMITARNGTNYSIEFSDALQSMSSFVDSSNLRFPTNLLQNTDEIFFL